MSGKWYREACRKRRRDLELKAMRQASCVWCFRRPARYPIHLCGYGEPKSYQSLCETCFRRWERGRSPPKPGPEQRS